MSDYQFDQYQDINFDEDINLPQLKFLVSTSDYSHDIKQAEVEDFIVGRQESQNDGVEVQFYEEEQQNSLEQVYQEIVRPVEDIEIKKTKTIDKKKNSNVVKKIGRIIDSHKSQYLLNGQNSGYTKMMLKLQKSNRSTLKNKIDGFNTSHLQALFDCKDRKQTSFNLNTTRKIFTKHLRREIFQSAQLKKPESKLLYLNSLKVCCLRFGNKGLAKRLQASEGHSS